jgi:6-phosphogluconolactonase (cycloisomerase 2 family)
VRTTRRVLLSGTLVLLLLASVQATWSAFSGTTANPGNSASSATVTITDNDSGGAMLSLSNSVPGATDTSCITVTYTGTRAANVRLYATSTGTVAPYVNLTVWRGTGSTFDDCTGFTADTADYAGMGGGIMYSGPLSAMPATWAAGIVDSSSAIDAESWATSEAHSYKFQLVVGNDNNGQSTSGSTSFTWEARNLITGYLTQLGGLSACVSDTGTSGACTDSVAPLDEIMHIAMSPDGRHVYAPATSSDALVAFSRNVQTGALTQLAGTAGCVSDTGSGGACTDGTALDGPYSVAVSPDGANVYAVSNNSSAVSVFARNATTGQLTQLAGTAGCVSDNGSGGACVDGNLLLSSVDVQVSPDGANVYVVAFGNSALATFSRNPSTGALTQLATVSGCVAETGDGSTCADGKAMQAPYSIAVSPDGKSAYLAADTSGAVAVFSRNTGTGVLTQLSGTDGCISDTGTSGACVDGVGLVGAFHVVVSPDNNNVYVAAPWSHGVAAFSRDPVTSKLTQLSGTSACIGLNGSSGACVTGKAMLKPRFLAISPDGDTVYAAAADANAIDVLSRDQQSGKLTQLNAGTNGCVSDTGGSCIDGTALWDPWSVIIDPDGKHVYASTRSGDGIAVFSRQR